MNLQLRLANYITRYAPSRHRVVAYLEKKKCQDIEAVLESIQYDESLMIDMWMRTMIALGKGRQEIAHKLIKKEFPKTLINEKIEASLHDIWNWSEYEPKIQRQTDMLIERGKSLPMVNRLLSQKYPYFRDGIKSLLSSYDDDDGLQKEIAKYRSRYDITDRQERQKLISAIMRKGYEYSKIQSYISSYL